LTNLSAQSAAGAFRLPTHCLNHLNLLTWAHEMVHATDHRNGKLTELGRHWRKETVAELGGAVLLQIIGYPHEADLGGCWKYIQSYAEKAGLEVSDA